MRVIVFFCDFATPLVRNSLGISGLRVSQNGMMMSQNVANAAKIALKPSCRVLVGGGNFGYFGSWLKCLRPRA